MAKVVYGREDGDEFEILEEEDGLFFQFVCGDTTVTGCTLVEPQLQELLKVIETAIKRLNKKPDDVKTVIHKAIKKHAELSDFDNHMIDEEADAIVKALKKSGHLK